MKKKLVRDNIPEIIRAGGNNPITYKASDFEYWVKLKEKLHEETLEFIESDDTQELVDILEVVLAICKFKEINEERLDLMRISKANTRGKFDERIILEKVE